MGDLERIRIRKSMISAGMTVTCVPEVHGPDEHCASNVFGLVEPRIGCELVVSYRLSPKTARPVSYIALIVIECLS